MDTIVVEPRINTRRYILIGAGAGLAWGIAMRAWMRYISVQPEFTWSGTLFILGASTIMGTALGFAWHRRAVGGVGWWRLAALTLILVGAGGAVMWPAVIFGGLALGRPWKPWIRVSLGAIAVGSQFPVITGIADNWKFGFIQIVFATLMYVPLLFAETWAFSVVFRPSKSERPTPIALRIVLVVLSMTALGLLALAVGMAVDV
ncbi:MAG: hypothetical protein R3246_08535 [Acidimicrobiia bacterium]|nr:hypothetical protein [Acidimicrobiia bacterium]